MYTNLIGQWPAANQPANQYLHACDYQATGKADRLVFHTSAENKWGMGYGYIIAFHNTYSQVLNIFSKEQYAIIRCQHCLSSLFWEEFHAVGWWLAVKELFCIRSTHVLTLSNSRGGQGMRRARVKPIDTKTMWFKPQIIQNSLFHPNMIMLVWSKRM